MSPGDRGKVDEERLPDGVRLRDLEMHLDARGVFTEVFRRSWDDVDPVQWNVVSSEAGVLRGVHVHVAHADYLVLITGRATIGLRDLRRGSPTDGLATTVTLTGERLQGISIPPGVAHGFLFHEPSLHVYSVSEYWDPADELACRWDDPDLGIAWPAAPTSLSDRDATAPPLSDLRARLDAALRS